jgi:hypothetical protein
MKNRMVDIASALVIGYAAVTSAHATPPTSTQWAATNDNGGLGGNFAFLNSNGVNPISLPDSWTTVWSPTNVVYSATFQIISPVTVTNYGSWDGTSYISSFGAPDTTTYGEVFIAPGSSVDPATLYQFNFLINNPSVGEDATFVLATWDPVNKRADTVLVSQPSFISNAGGYIWNVNTFPGQGEAQGFFYGFPYVAYLTVAGGVPEPSTWAMMGLGFATLGFVAYRRKRGAPAGLA